MICQSFQFGKQDPQVLCLLGDVNTSQLFYGLTKGQRMGEGGISGNPL
jgi:hypothetical protein